MNQPEQQTLQRLLTTVRQRFYAELPKNRWHQDRHALIRALTWPANWMHLRGVSLSQARYARLIEERLDAILRYGDPKRFQGYFPAYLLKCIQDYFAHNEDDLTHELKHIRNCLYGWEIRLEIYERTRQENSEIEALARVHRILTVKTKAKKNARPQGAQQLELF